MLTSGWCFFFPGEGIQGIDCGDWGCQNHTEFEWTWKVVCFTSVMRKLSRIQSTPKQPMQLTSQVAKKALAKPWCFSKRQCMQLCIHSIRIVIFPILHCFEGPHPFHSWNNFNKRVWTLRDFLPEHFHPQKRQQKTTSSSNQLFLQVRYFILLPWYLALKNAFLCWWSIMAAKRAQFFKDFLFIQNFLRKSVGGGPLVRGNTHLFFVV